MSAYFRGIHQREAIVALRDENGMRIKNDSNDPANLLPFTMEIRQCAPRFVLSIDGSRAGRTLQERDNAAV